MNDAEQLTDIQHRMAEIRSELAQDVEGMVDNARTLTDWRYYVNAHPWWCLGIAVAAGYVAVPKRVEVIRLDPSALADMAQQRPLFVESRSPTQKMGAALVSSIASVAVRWGAERLTQWGQDLFAERTVEGRSHDGATTVSS